MKLRLEVVGFVARELVDNMGVACEYHISKVLRQVGYSS